MKNSRIKSNIELPYNPGISLGHIPKRIESRDSNRYLQMNVHSSIIHCDQKVEITQMSISVWKDKQNVVYSCNRKFFNLKKKKNAILIHTTTSMKFGDTILSEIGQTWKDNFVWFHFCWLTRIIKCIKRGSKIMVTGVARGDNGKLLFNGYRASFGEDEKFWRWMVVVCLYNNVIIFTLIEL